VGECLFRAWGRLEGVNVCEVVDGLISANVIEGALAGINIDGITSHEEPRGQPSIQLPVRYTTCSRLLE